MATPSSPSSISAAETPDQASIPSRAGQDDRSATVCLLCRRRKVKCDRRKPSCSFCVKNGTAAQCRYVLKEKKPGLRAGYVSQLEDRLDRLEAEVRELKSRQPQQPQETSPHQNNASPQNHVANNFNDNVGSNYVSPTSQQPGSQLPSGNSRCEVSVHVDGIIPSSLSVSMLMELVTIWFDKYHRWFPILHHPSLLQVLHDSQGQLQNLEASPLYVVLKAITAVTLPHVGFSTMLSLAQRQELSSTYRQEIAMEAMDHLSLPSLQAVLIITILEFGDGKISKFWNLVALCKRMAMQLGLRDLVVNQCINFNNPFILPPRMLPLPNTLIDQEERIRAYWMTEVLDGSSTMGVAWNLSLIAATTPWSTELATVQRRRMVDIPSPSGETSSSSSFFISVASFGGDHLELSSSFTSYVGLVANELYAVHQFLQQPFDRRSAAGRAKWQAECKAVDDRLQKWRASSPFLGSFRGCYNNDVSTGTNVFDPIIVLAFAMFDTAIIALYQRLAFPMSGLEEQHGPYYHAIQRCLDACDEMTQVVRSVSDSDLENMSPHIIFPIFVAARFFLVHARLISVETPRNLDLLIYSLRVCGQRWNLARRLEKVLRTAAAEREVTVKLTTLPPQFFDLQYSHLDIDKVLEVWAEGQDSAGASSIPTGASPSNGRVANW